MATVLSPPEERIILHEVSWETYESLLADHQNRSVPRFAYDRGVLEIMSPSAEHEEANDLIKLLVNVLAEEMNLDIKGFGSTTFKRADLSRGFEPDSCFYIQNADRISDSSNLDLTNNPPPDLIVEIDITSPSLNKFPIYARVGVPEIWRYDGQKVAIFLLEEGAYVEHEESYALPRVTTNALTDFIAEGRSKKRTVWLRALREWARARPPA